MRLSRIAAWMSPGLAPAAPSDRCPCVLTGVVAGARDPGAARARRRRRTVDELMVEVGKWRLVRDCMPGQVRAPGAVALWTGLFSFSLAAAPVDTRRMRRARSVSRNPVKPTEPSEDEQ